MANRPFFDLLFWRVVHDIIAGCRRPARMVDWFRHQQGVVIAMNVNARDQEIKEQIRHQVARAGRQLAGYRVFLFGSRACGTARPRSDFDIGVMGPAPLPPAVFQQIEDWLDEIDTLYRIDWVDMNRVTEAFRTEAMRQTEVLYAP